MMQEAGLPNTTGWEHLKEKQKHGTRPASDSTGKLIEESISCDVFITKAVVMPQSAEDCPGWLSTGALGSVAAEFHG